MRFGRTILLTTFISILAIMAGCTQGTSEARLAQIDSLLERKLYDSARAELSRIAPSDLKSEEDIAHYNLQKTNLCFRNGEVLPNDSMIDISIKHYRQNGDKQKLALSLYIKGRLQHKRNETKNALRNLLEAAGIAKDTDDDALKAKIYANLAYFNKRLGENRYALKYIKQALIYAEKIKYDKDIIIPDIYMQASDIYGNLKDTANAIAYIEKCIPYIEHTDSFGKANIYSGLANIYNVKGDFEKAKKYGDMSINLRPKHDTYYILSQTYKNKGDMATADTMIKQAIKTATPNYKMMMMAEIRKEKQGQGRYKDAAALGDSMMSLNNSITRRNQADSIIEIQATFDIAQKDRQQIAKLKHGIICIAIVAIALIAISIMKQYTQNALFKRKIRKAKHELQAIIDNYSEFKNILYNTLNAAAESNKDNAEDSPKAGQPEERPQETMAQAPNRAEGIAPEARQCLAEMYEMTDYAIINNNCIAKWSNDKTARFIGYCCCAIPGLNDKMENDYTNLTKQNKLMLIFIYLNKEKEDICKIMGLSESAFRQAQNRLKKKAKTTAAA